jgi:hypothetical protein
MFRLPASLRKATIGWILKSRFHPQVTHLYRTFVRQPRSIDCAGLNGVRDCAKLFEGGFEVSDDFLGENVGMG